MRRLLGNIKRFLTRLIGTSIDILFWKFRHIIDPGWAGSYKTEASLNHAHRILLLEKISAYAPFESLLELGCASGPNLFLIAKKIPNVKLYGIDVSKPAIKQAKRWFSQERIPNVTFLAENIRAINKKSSKSVDIIITDAVLIYIDRREILSILKECIRIAKKAIILFEWHSDKEQKSFFDGHWVHNFRNLFREYSLLEKIRITKMQKELWPGSWEKYGSVIEVNLSSNA